MKSILFLVATLGVWCVVARIQVPTFGPELHQIRSSQMHVDDANIEFFSEASMADPTKIAVDFFHENFPSRSGYSAVVVNSYKSGHNGVQSMCAGWYLGCTHRLLHITSSDNTYSDGLHLTLIRT